MRLTPVALTGLWLAACATASPPLEPQSGHLTCLDDSLECINRRQGALRQMTADSSRAWMKQPATPEAYAAGVRLFAMRTKKRDLSCEELQRGKSEADAATAALRGAQGRLTSAQVARGILFAGEVSRELAGEIGRRCKRA